MTALLTLLNLREARTYYERGAWQADTMHARVLAHARRAPHDFALRDGTRRLTWQQLLDWTDAVAANLEAAGLRPGSRVSVWLPNRVEAVLVQLACSRNGYVCNPSLHQSYTSQEIAGLLQRIDCEAFFGQIGYGADAGLTDAQAVIAAVGSLKRVCWLTSERQPDRPAGHAFPQAAGARPSSPPSDNPDQVVYLAFTSGTTGVPKAVMHSDNTLLANGRALVRDWKYEPGTVILSLSPLSHHIATVGLAQSLAGGHELVLNDPPAGRSVLDWIIETGATYVMGVPTHAMDVLAQAQARGMRSLGRVRVFYMAGASITPSLAENLLAFGARPQNVYGMTETGSHQYTRPDDDVRTIVQTCGRACDNYEVSLWDQDNPDVPAAPGAVGEIASRGPLRMLGYFGNQEATEKSFNAHGWFLSGDLGRFDEHGNLQIVGRKKDLIIRGGHNIHPSTIETHALRHPHIARAAAFGVADERLGEKVCLAIIPRPGHSVEADAVLCHLHGSGLSKYDMPEYFLSMDSFPLTPSGKILKRTLAEWVREKRIAPAPIRFNASMHRRAVTESA